MEFYGIFMNFMKIPQNSHGFSGKFHKIPGILWEIWDPIEVPLYPPNPTEIFRKNPLAHYTSSQGKCAKTFVFLVFSAQENFRKS